MVRMGGMSAWADGRLLVWGCDAPSNQGNIGRVREARKTNWHPVVLEGLVLRISESYCPVNR